MKSECPCQSHSISESLLVTHVTASFTLHNMIRVFMRCNGDPENGPETHVNIPLPADRSKIVLTGKSMFDPAGFGQHGSEIDLSASQLPCHRKGFVTTRAMQFHPNSFSHYIRRNRSGSKSVFRLNVTFASSKVILIHIPRCIPSSAIAADGYIRNLEAVAFLNRPDDKVIKAQVVVAEITHFKMVRAGARRERRLHSQREIKATQVANAGTLFVNEFKVRIETLLKELKSLSPEDRAFIKSQL